MNKLYFGDNLNILQDHIADESIDLIYLDPPFNSKRDYNLLFKTPKGESSHAQIEAFKDTWYWGEQAEREFNEIIRGTNTNVSEVIQSFRRFLDESDMMAYLVMMTKRLLELHRVLKSTGSLYLHCDPTASHYLKILMDSVFQSRNFRNEIVWCYRKWSINQSQFAKNHDTLLFYSKTKNNKFNQLYIPLSEGTIKRWKGRKQKAVFEDGQRLADSEEAMSDGTPMYDWWEISVINPAAKERLGYPTQKPLALLERIIQASSNEGDIVIDPFCGCGTAVHAAHKLNRQWIGIDITHLAISLIEKRMQDAFPGIQFEVEGTPKDIAGAVDLANRDKYQFQWWACSLVNAQPLHGKKKGADGGIDGLIYFSDFDQGANKAKTGKIIVSVKGGQNVTLTMLKDLITTVQNNKADIGLFVTLSEPTKPMITEAIKCGYYTAANGKEYPRIQILTIEGLLNGTEWPKYYDMGQGQLTFKHAQREDTERITQAKLNL